jgi:hypothetical protein
MTPRAASLPREAPRRDPRSYRDSQPPGSLKGGSLPGGAAAGAPTSEAEKCYEMKLSGLHFDPWLFPAIPDRLVP